MQRGERQRLHEPAVEPARARRDARRRRRGRSSRGSSAATTRPRSSGAGGRPPTEAAPFFADLFSALEATYKLDHRDPARRGWPAFESGLHEHPGPALSADAARDRLRAAARGPSPWRMGEWFGVLTPFLLSPTISLLLGPRAAARAALLQPDDPLTERSFTELITLAESVVGDHPVHLLDDHVGERRRSTREPFVNALVDLPRARRALRRLDPDDRHRDRRPVARRRAGLIAGGMLGARRLRPDPRARSRAAAAQPGRRSCSACRRSPA